MKSDERSVASSKADGRRSCPTPRLERPRSLRGCRALVNVARLFDPAAFPMRSIDLGILVLAFTMSAWMTATDAVAEPATQSKDSNGVEEITVSAERYIEPQLGAVGS